MLELEGYAALRATIERSGDREAALTAADLTVPQWIAVQRHWLRALAREAGQGRRALLRRFEAAYGLAPMSTPAVAAPPVLQPASAPPAASPASAPPSPIAAVPPSPIAPAPQPIAAAPPSVPFVAPVAPRVEPDFSEVEVTPFGGPRVVVVPPSAADEVAAEAAAMIGATSAAMTALDDDDLADFVAPMPAPKVEASPVATGPLRLDDVHDPLPFGGASTSAPPSAASDVAEEAVGLVGETAFVGALSDADLAEALPFAPRTRLTLEQYASLVAELHGQPSSARGPILVRYGLDETSFQALEAEWRERFAADPGSYGTFRARYDEYSAWLRRN